MYFIDELNGGNVYKYTPAARLRAVKRGADYFAAGQTFVLRVGDGNTPNATGAYTWVPITDAATTTTNQVGNDRTIEITLPRDRDRGDEDDDRDDR